MYYLKLLNETMNWTNNILKLPNSDIIW
jgi:hypothetical protein